MNVLYNEGGAVLIGEETEVIGIGAGVSVPEVILSGAGETRFAKVLCVVLIS